MKKLLSLLLVMTYLVPFTARADWIIDIFIQLLHANKMLKGVQDINQGQLDRLSDIRKTNTSQLTELSKLTSGLTGTHHFGSQYDDGNRFHWGKDSNRWQSLLALTSQGGGDGELGEVIRQLANQFPMRDSLGSTNEVENEYYRMQAQTTLASRANSQLAYDQINHEADTLQQLHQLIDTTPDNKSAVDLNNRLVSENAMINIQQTKLLATLTQQMAIDAQSKANLAKENAEFFDIK